MIDDDDDDDGWRDSKCRSHPLINGCDKKENIQPILFKLWILDLITSPNKLYDTQECLGPIYEAPGLVPRLTC